MFKGKFAIFLLLSISLILPGCSSKIAKSKTDAISETEEDGSVIPIEEEEETAGVIVFEESAVTAPPPVPAQSTEAKIEDQIIFVPSDLAQEFPEKAHISIAEQMGIDVEEIFYYNNRTEVLAIYVKTDYEMSDQELKELQDQLYLILWDFTSAKVTTIIKKDQEIYKIVTSKKDKDRMALMIYDFSMLKMELGKVIQKIEEEEDYPLRKKEIFGVYFVPGLLNRDTVENFAETTLYFVVAEEDAYLEYSTIKNKIDVNGQQPLIRATKKLFYDENYKNVITVCPDGSLLYRDNESSFLKKYNGFRMKID